MPLLGSTILSPDSRKESLPEPCMPLREDAFESHSRPLILSFLPMSICCQISGLCHTLYHHDICLSWGPETGSHVSIKRNRDRNGSVVMSLLQEHRGLTLAPENPQKVSYNKVHLQSLHFRDRMRRKDGEVFECSWVSWLGLYSCEQQEVTSQTRYKETGQGLSCSCHLHTHAFWSLYVCHSMNMSISFVRVQTYARSSTHEWNH